MLTRYVIKNFKSFKNETVVDLTATNYKILSDINTFKGVTKGALFVGANASGKSNVIIAVKLLLDLLFAKFDVNWGIYPCFFSEDNQMFLEYEFNIENQKIIYTIQYQKKEKLISEKLHLENDLMLNRIGSNAESSITENKVYNDISNDTLLLREIYFNTKFRGNDILQKWFEFLTNSIYFDLSARGGNIYKDIDISLQSYLDKTGANEINEFFNKYKFNQQIEYSKNSAGNIISIQSEDNSIFFKRKGIEEPIPYDFESLGNKTLLNLLPIFFYVVKNGGILILDEFSSGFHNELEELLIKYFMKFSGHSQLLFVSHSTNLLSNRLLRPDQMYSVDFDEGSGSTLKRFSSEKIREAQNPGKMYLGGVFNGLPNYREDYEDQ